MAIQPPQRFELDDLTHVEREARTIYAPGATPGDVLVVQSDHSLVAAPGGGSMPFKWVTLPVAFGDAGLAAGIELYTPTVGEYLLDGWVEPITAWDGTTPQADLGTAVGITTGLFGNASGPVPLDGPDFGPATVSGDGLDWVYASLMQSYIAYETTQRPMVPFRFSATNPLKVWVSQDGKAGGLDPGSTHGAMVVVLRIGTP